MALLEDIGGGISNFFGGLLGGGQPAQAAEGAQTQQPTDLMSMLSADDQRRMMYSMLGQIGSTLLAAGQKQMPAQRAQYLAQLGAIPGNVQREAMGNLQARMMQSQLAERMQNQQSLAQISNLMKDPAAFKQTYGFDLPPGMSAAQVQNIVQQRATSQFVNPLARQIQEAQYADILANREKAIMQLETQKRQLESIGESTAAVDAQIGALRRIYGTPGAPAPAAAPVAPAPTPMLVTPSAPAAAPAVTPGGVVQPSAPAAAPTAEQPSAAPVTPQAEAPAEVAPVAPPSLFTPPAAPAAPTTGAAKQGASILSQFPKIPQEEVRARLQAAITAGKVQEEIAKMAQENYDRSSKDEQQVLENELRLRGSFDAKTAKFSDLQTAYRTMAGLSGNKEAISDVMLITSLYKVFDPTSIVSTNEQGVITEASGKVPAIFQKMTTRLMEGKVLLPEERAQIMRAATDRFREEYRTYEQAYNDAFKQASSYKGLDPNRAIPDRRDDDVKQQMDALNQRDQLSKSISVDAINNATADDLALLNTRVLGAKQLDAYRKRLSEIGNIPAPQPTGEQAPALRFGTTSAVGENAPRPYTRGQELQWQKQRLAPFLLNLPGQ
jgi:hypothetical protein